VVFAVWEPILPTDWRAPGTTVLSRLSDQRVQQFWDPNHLIAGVLKRTQGMDKLEPECCERKGFLWDLTAAFPPGPLWSEAPRGPVLFNGPVVDTTSDLEARIAKTK